MTPLLTALLAGFALGAVLAAVLLRAAEQRRFEADAAEWQAAELPRVRAAALDAERAAVKARVGEDFAGGFEPLPFAPADARFVGDPVAFVVFDGHTEVKARTADALRGVVFVAVDQAGVPPSAASRAVEECVAAGRVQWLTLTLG